ncbi:MAG: ribonuclease J [Methanotrichaceae archaeon]|nr:ribonuclease J [Methanotrichaceae archaeon]
MVSLTVYDGAMGIGGNKLYLEEGGKGVLLDFGKNFGKYGLFYEEFLKNRDTRGIHDQIYLGLLPKLNIYRPDLIPSDLSLSPYPTLNIAAVLLSHAHMDHAGNLGVLRKDIPIMASPESIAILKGMQDTTSSSLDTDTTYISLRKPDDNEGLYLGSAGGNYVGKDLLCTEPPSDELLLFLSTRPGHDLPKTKKKLDPGNCTHYKDHDLPFEVTACPVDHSIFGAVAYILQGETSVAYTGDFRLHGKQEQATRKFVQAARDTSVLIIEGTRADSKPSEEKTTEQSVCEICRDSVEQAKGLVIADFSARNFERLESFQEIAQKTGRELVVTAKDAYMLHSMGCIDGICRTESMKIYGEIVDKKSRKWETEVVQKQCVGQYITPGAIRNNPNNYILCFSFFDMKHLLDIKPAGGTYIYSACEAFNEEMKIDFRRMHQWLRYFNIEPCGFSMEKDEDGEYKPAFDHRYHASGHASGDDIRWVIDQIDPDHLVPVHTETREWFVDNFENARLVEEGQLQEF